MKTHIAIWGEDRDECRTVIASASGDDPRQVWKEAYRHARICLTRPPFYYAIELSAFYQQGPSVTHYPHHTRIRLPNVRPPRDTLRRAMRRRYHERKARELQERVNALNVLIAGHIQRAREAS